MMEFLTLIVCLVAVPVLAYVAANLAVPHGGPLHGVYAVPGRWYSLKYYITKLLLSWSKRRKCKVRQRAMNYHMLQDKMKEVGKMEFFNGVEKGQNALYINGCDQGGTTRLVARIAVQPNDRREVWFLLRLPGIGDLVLPGHPDCITDNVRPGEGFSGAGLSCTPIEPLRTWRISFNGLCRIGIRHEWSTEDDRPLVHVRCSLLWSTFTTFYDFAGDANLGLAADIIAREKWTTQFLAKVQNMHQDHYTQFGMIHGTVQVDDQEEVPLLMRGVKERLIGEQQLRDIHTHISNYIVLENGNSLYAGASCTPGCLSSENSGFMMRAVGDVIPASSVDLPLAVLMENADEIPKNFTFSMKPETRERLDIQVHIEDMVYFNMGNDWSVRLGQGLSRFTVNGVQGWGICQTFKRFGGGRPISAKEPVPKLYREPDVSSVKGSTVLVVPLTAISCQVSALTGGKGSQLAKLIALSNQIPAVEYEVPPGFCITTVAFKRHLEYNRDLQNAVKELREVSCTVRKGDFKETCERTVAIFAKTTVSTQLKDEIAAIFTKTFKEPHKSKTYAVRSSAVGEDTSVTSAAGQLQTFLGLNSMEKIFEAIQQCWASNFAFQAVQYRRQYGQSVEAPIAVVVQEIVPAESAGVVFSRDPMTGNPARVVINSNYGLGESVVSGITEADTVTLHVDGSKALTIGEKKIGRKDEAVSVAALGNCETCGIAVQLECQSSLVDTVWHAFSGPETTPTGTGGNGVLYYSQMRGGGTQTTHQTETKAASCSVTDELCLRLGRIALMLDECFSDARDIEWASVGDKVYLLQARAITTFDVPTRYELLHEFDTGLPLDNIWISTANIQEMCPGAVTPLTMSNFFLDCDVLSQVSSSTALQRPISLPAMRNVIIGYNHPFISLTNLTSMFLWMSPIPNDQMGGVLTGKPFDVRCVRQAKKLNAPLLPLWRMYYNRARFLLKILFNRSIFEREFAKAVNHLMMRWETAQDQYDDICMYPNDRSEILEYHAMESHKSAITQEIVASLIIKYSDQSLIPAHIALLLSSCPDVESAKVPLAIEQVAMAIMEEGMSESFHTMSPADALEWLQSPSSGGAGRSFSSFLQHHGHRCVREVELRDKSWSMDPVKVIPTLQAILASGSHTSSEKKREMTAAEAVDQLGLAIPALTRKILVNYLVPKAREGVADRESGKSMFIKINHNLKEAYWRLANLMVIEGRLPDEELLFFFTQDELGRLLKDGSPALISRALRRRRILPEQDSLTFDLVSTGRPQPISEEEDVGTEFKLEGTPISQGIVKSTACVVKDLKDAKNIKKGDILITRITDIGWSPYFPLIGGLVTEIGGVLSHGAVVAREYGIPCVVNVQRATRVFKSGDIVVMNGGQGSVEKMELPEVTSSTEATPMSNSQ